MRDALLRQYVRQMRSRRFIAGQTYKLQQRAEELNATTPLVDSESRDGRETVSTVGNMTEARASRQTDKQIQRQTHTNASTSINYVVCCTIPPYNT